MIKKILGEYIVTLILLNNYFLSIFNFLSKTLYLKQ